MELLINRSFRNDKQTIGQMLVIDNDRVIYGCNTLELPDLDNQQNISCIPDGIYKVKKRISPKFGAHFHITDVPNRSYILIHKGNYHTQIRGCVLVGKSLTDINKDGFIDVSQSADTVNKLLGLMPDEFNLIIM